MLANSWPLFELSVRTPRLELRLARDDELPELLDVIDRGIHDPATMPFKNPWTDLPRAERERSSLQWWWRQRASWTPQDWTWCGTVFVEGHPIGSQDLMASNFSTSRQVRTGSWLGREYQGRGFGSEMRAAVLHLAFEGLGARTARSGAFLDNLASIGTSRSLGYRDVGRTTALRRGEQAALVIFELDRAEWRERRRDDIEIVGLERCREFFGLAEPDA